MLLRSKPLDGKLRQKAERLLKQQARRVIGLAVYERMLSVIRSETAQPFWSAAKKRTSVAKMKVTSGLGT